tara:strand:- start:391 stop:708 length:318 start_codon:yes stop_codon:yes gene_type:complete
MSEAKSHRKIQSFVKRSGRLSKAQSLGLNDLWSDFGIEVNEKKVINFDEVFANQNDITLEVGFGNGDSLLEMAIKQPVIILLVLRSMRLELEELLTRRANKTSAI